MTKENKRENIALEVAKAERRLASARVLLAEGDCDGAASQAYYHVFHCARALLLMDGLESKTHSGIAHLINLHFVRSGRMSPETALLLSRLEQQRELAEYDAAAIFTPSMAETAIADATAYREAVRAILLEAGYALA